MKEIARTVWTVCIPAFVALILGIIPILVYFEGKSYLNLLLILLGMFAIAFLTIAIIAFLYDFKHTWKKAHTFHDFVKKK